MKRSKQEQIQTRRKVLDVIERKRWNRETNDLTFSIAANPKDIPFTDFQLTPTENEMKIPIQLLCATKTHFGPGFDINLLDLKSREKLQN